VDERRLRTLLGPELLEDSGIDLGQTMGRTTGAWTAESEAETLVLEGSGPESGEGIGEQLVESGFELVEEVGRGGMNVVFRARQAGLEREVAVKRLLSRRRASRSARWAFLSEAAVTAQLDHPNVIPVYGLSLDSAGDAALAMKLMRGKTWRHRLREQFAGHGPEDPPPDLEGNLRVLIGVANAVAFAHSRGVLHRDLKPDNVMIGDFGEVLVLDWGLAVRFRATDSAVRAPSAASVEKMAGTPVYMAPEMVEGKGADLGPPTDVYLLGGLLHEILTGRPPHAGRKLADVLLAAFESRPPLFPASVPTELQDICRKALAQAPEERFPTAVEFRDAIEDYLAHSESLQICAASMQGFEACKARIESGVELEDRADVYSELRDAIAGFSAARGVWPENRIAEEGEARARLLLAGFALDMGELGTAESALRGQAGEDAESLHRQISEAARKRAATLRTTRRVSIALVVLQLLVGTALGLWGRDELRAYHFESEVAELRRLAPITALAIRQSGARDRAELAPLADRIARDLATGGPIRVTIAALDGAVLADSEMDAGGLENHADRKEFIEALRSGAGWTVRWSQTLGQELLYYAIAVRGANGAPILLARLAVPVDFIAAELRALVGAVSVAFVLSVLIMSFLTMLLTRHLRRAIEQIR
jgi:serine/threonine protein kinase